MVPGPPQPASSPPDPAASVSQEDAESIEPSPTNGQATENAGSSVSAPADGLTDARGQNAVAGRPDTPPKPRTWDDIHEPAEVLAELRTIISQDPSTGIEVVAQGIKRFTELVAKAGVGAPQSRQLSDLVQDIWQELHRWEKQGNRRENRRSQIISLLEDPSASYGPFLVRRTSVRHPALRQSRETLQDPDTLRPNDRKHSSTQSTLE